MESRLFFFVVATAKQSSHFQIGVACVSDWRNLKTLIRTRDVSIGENLPHLHEHSSYRSLWAHVKAIPRSTHSAVDQQAPQITAFSTCCTMYFLPGLGCRSVARMHHRHYLLTDWLFINKETRFSRIVYFCVNCSEHTRNKDVR